MHIRDTIGLGKDQPQQEKPHPEAVGEPPQCQVHTVKEKQQMNMSSTETSIWPTNYPVQTLMTKPA